MTNGIAHRRWLNQSNPELAGLLDELIGAGYTTDADELEKLAQKARAYHDNYGSEKTADVMWGLLQKKFPFLKEIEIQKNNEA